MAISLFGLLVADPASAQLARSGLDRFTHTRWTIDEGAPTAITELAQTADGWLWLASQDGLYRFDGVSFERIAAPIGSPMERSSPSALLVTRKGRLWVGYAQGGGIAEYRDGRLFETPMAKRPSRIVGMAETPDGAIWALGGVSYSENRLHRWKDGEWKTLDQSLGLPNGFPEKPCVTADGTLWIVVIARDNRVVASLRPNARRFETHPVDEGARCAIDRQGRLWIADLDKTQLAAGADGNVIAHPITYPGVRNVYVPKLAFDTAGGLWGATNSVGIFYIPNAARRSPSAQERLEQFGVADGLSSDLARSPLGDREGNIWFGADIGLDLFRPSIVTHQTGIGHDPRQIWAMSTSPDALYVSTNDAVYKITSGPPQKVGNQGLTGMCPARAGGFWEVLPSGISHFKDGKRTSFAPPAGEALIGTCAEDGAGRLWVGIMPGRAMWRDAHGWHHVSKPGPLMEQPDLVVTASGDVAYVAAKNLVTLSGDTVTTTSLAQYDIGNISKLSSGLHDLFVSGNNGLLRIRGGRIDRIDARRFPWVARLRGLVQTGAGETWMRSDHSISRVATADLDKAFDNVAASLERRYYDLRDGLSPAQSQTVTGPQLGVSRDGRIILLERAWLSYIDPAQLKRNMAPAPVAIQSLTAGGQVYRDPRSLALPAGTRSLEIAYAGLSLSSSQRTEFRYRLSGVDDDWVSTGTRRLAAYTNLGPGKYRFEVLAANSDGVWNPKEATLEFEIPPTFIQSWPFKLLCGLIVLLLLWIAYSMRLRAVAEGVRLRMAERTEERERIARELHDTLLQSVQALTLRFQLAIDELPATEPARSSLEGAIDRADQVIAEGRNRVADLRPTDETRDIETIISDLVKRQAFDPNVTVLILKRGAPRPLTPYVLDEVSRIAGEAIYNVWRHASASRLMIEIGFDADFHLRISDDGVGIDPDVAEGGKAGHFGLLGMQERARRLRGKFTIRAREEGGSEVELIVREAIAFKSAWRDFLGFWRRRP